MYRAIIYFEDLKDGRHPYNVGDAFPRKGLEVSEDRIRELSGIGNMRRMAVIEEVKEVVPKKIVKKLVNEEVKDESSSNTNNAKSKSRKTKQRK